MKQVSGLPPKQGLYDPGQEHDACGIGLVVNIRGARSHDIVSQAISPDQLVHPRGAAARTTAAMERAFCSKFPTGAGTFASIGITCRTGRSCGMVFLHRDDDFRKAVEHQIELWCGMRARFVLGWRSPPINESTWARPP